MRDGDGVWYDEEAHFCVTQPLLSDLLIANNIQAKLVTVTMDLTEPMQSALRALFQAVKIKDVITPR